MRLLVALVVVAVLLTGVDLAAKRAAEQQLADVTHRAVAAAGPTSAQIDSFPFLGRLVVAGRVARVRVRQVGVAAGPLRFGAVSVDLHGVSVDRDRLLRRREVELTGIDRGTVTAELTQEAVSAVLGVQVTFAGGRATARVGGVAVSVAPSSEDGALLLRPAAGRALRLALPPVPLLPCVDRVAVGDGRAVLACTVHDVPPELLRAVSRRTRRALSR